jgi:hypothetical protein
METQRRRSSELFERYAEEEAEAAETEARENAQSVLSVRVPTQLAESLKERATVEQVENIARRVMHESADH